MVVNCYATFQNGNTHGLKKRIAFMRASGAFKRVKN